MNPKNGQKSITLICSVKLKHLELKKTFYLYTFLLYTCIKYLPFIDKGKLQSFLTQFMELHFFIISKSSVLDKKVTKTNKRYYNGTIFLQIERVLATLPVYYKLFLQ